MHQPAVGRDHCSKVSLEQCSAGSQAASDKTKAAGQTVADSAAQGTKNVQDAVKPYTDAAADHTKAGACETTKISFFSLRYTDLYGM